MNHIFKLDYHDLINFLIQRFISAVTEDASWLDHKVRHIPTCTFEVLSLKIHVVDFLFLFNIAKEKKN